MPRRHTVRRESMEEEVKVDNTEETEPMVEASAGEVEEAVAADVPDEPERKEKRETPEPHDEEDDD